MLYLGLAIMIGRYIPPEQLWANTLYSQLRSITVGSWQLVGSWLVAAKNEENQVFLIFRPYDVKICRAGQAFTSYGSSYAGDCEKKSRKLLSQPSA